MPAAAAAPAPAEPGPPANEKDVLRQRTADLNAADYQWLCGAGRFGQAPEHTLEPFPGVRVTLVQDGRESDKGTITWTGHVKGAPQEAAVISARHVCAPARGTTPVLDGLVHVGARAYHLTTLPGERARVRVSEEDPHARRHPTPDNAVLDQHGARELRDSLKHRAPASADAPVVIDVLAGYTPAAVQRLGSEQAMLTRLRLAESYMNQALADSDVAASIDIVDSYDTGYRGDQTARRMLDKLSRPDDPELGEAAHRRREELGVDLVTVINDVPDGSSGQGSLPTRGRMDSELAYSAVDVQSLTEWYNLGHEIGHNLGMFHDRATLERQVPGGYEQLLNSPSGTGWITPRRDHHTLMAYAESCGGLCTPVNQYSNTENMVEGQPLGDARNNNAALARRTTPVVADYRALKVQRARHRLTLGAGPNGTLRPAVHGPYTPGSTVAVTAEPAYGYHVGAWLVDGRRHGITDEHVTVTMDRPHTLKAVFTRS
ncbi:reprolysin-like metallopeptidase [Streptomyces sp. NPDC002564]|uniref:InlB B-repeat-containing protein n=1 Tax=Streptomyces sp. NPDC002564 TaxID=3364649 RepID=UPI003691CD12